MGKEQEWKLAVPDAETLEAILHWDALQRLFAEAPRLYRMQTTYYDTAERTLSARHITLRRRMENDCSVVCVKAPLAGEGDPSIRGEWELESDDIGTALPQLIARGAPAVLPDAEALLPVCGAEFQRRAVLLRFSDESLSELALDEGSLLGALRRVPLCELELEQKRGAPAQTLRLLQTLQARFALQAQPLSKYARAILLA